MTTNTKGKVILAGAGPGDPDLITVKLQKCLAIADVILTDRLVNPAIIKSYASKEVLVIETGKQGYSGASITQESINELLIEHALSGKTVLRLKGGDIAFFSNVFDELEALSAHEIEFEIIPGITAASGASAYAGIPLTARNLSQGVQFLTFNPNSSYSPERWKQLATSKETLVFYMASKNITSLAELLLRYTRTPLTPVAIVSQATTSAQQVHVSTLQNCLVDFEKREFDSPSLVIIGEVVNLHDRFNWFHSNEAGPVFKDLVAE